MASQYDQYDRASRVRIANRFLSIISEHGRRFFHHQGRIAHFELRNNCVWFIDDYSQIAIYTHHWGRWKGFSHGGTMRNLVKALRDYIMGRSELPLNHLGPWPEGGDPWGYGAEMEQVRIKAQKLREDPDSAQHTDGPQ